MDGAVRKLGSCASPLPPNAQTLRAQVVRPPGHSLFVLSCLCLSWLSCRRSRETAALEAREHHADLELGDGSGAAGSLIRT